MVTFDRTRLRARQLDRERLRKFGQGATIKLFEKAAGREDGLLAEITEGWSAEDERRAADVESTSVISIAEQGGVTTEIMARVSRVLFNGVRYSVENWQAPGGAPRLWTIFAREIKPGAVKR